MKRYILYCFVIICMFGCSSVAMRTEKLQKPFVIEARFNYLPTVLGIKQPAYTIYEGSKWNCNYSTSNGDFVCCSQEPFSSMSPWKYCLLVDDSYSGIGFFELGAGSYSLWPERKEQLFFKTF